MAFAIRPRRSVLYMPASNPRALEKAKTLNADGFVFDCEDAIAPDMKEVARRQAIAAANSADYGKREVVVRVNGLDTPWGYQDLVAVASCGAHAILLPKIQSAEMVRRVEEILLASGLREETALWVMIETPLGVLNVREIAQATPRLRCMVMGTSDLSKDLQAQPSKDRLALLTSLSMAVLAARAYGLSILDGVHQDLTDDDGFTRACWQGVELGFDGKSLIHPKTIDTANRIFAPSSESISNARRIIAAHADANNKGQGVVVVDGKMIENLHVESAWRLVELAEAIETLHKGGH